MTACSQDVSPTKNQPKSLSYRIVNIYPHNTKSFTEGLFWHENRLFESTAGLAEYPQTQSEFGIINLKTGNIESKARLDKNIYFWEGITILNDKLYQVTYKNQKWFIYDTKSWQQVWEFNYKNSEWWGLTNDGRSIIMSDGTDTLTFFDPNNFEATKTLHITENWTAVDKINELEYADGYIYANIWLSNRIVKINAKNGNIEWSLDLSAITKENKTKYLQSLEMNGIAYHPTKNTFWITGKFWGNIYEIEILEKE